MSRRNTQKTVSCMIRSIICISLITGVAVRNCIAQDFNFDWNPSAADQAFIDQEMEFEESSQTDPMDPSAQIGDAKLVLEPKLVYIKNPNPKQNAQFGRAVEKLDDINSDGVDDFAIGAPGNDKVYLFSGLNYSLIQTIKDPHGLSGHCFGMSINSIGDIDKDGIEDIAIGAPSDGCPGKPSTNTPNQISGLPNPPQPSLGRAIIFSGATRKAIRVLQPKGTDYDMFGSRIAALGDIIEEVEDADAQNSPFDDECASNEYLEYLGDRDGEDSAFEDDRAPDEYLERIDE